MRISVALIAGVLLFAAPVRADPIWSIDWPSTAAMDLHAPNGTLYAGDVSGFPIWHLAAGPYLSLETDAYPFTLTTNSAVWGAMDFTAQTIRPQTDLDDAVLDVPFGFTGAMHYLVSSASFAGAGLMALTLHRAGGDWQFVSASYPGSVGAPVTGDTAPEPAAWLLLGTGLVGFWWKRRPKSAGFI